MVELGDWDFERLGLRTPEHMGFTRGYDVEDHTRWVHPGGCVAAVMRCGRWWRYWVYNGLVQKSGKGYRCRGDAYRGLLWALKAVADNREFFPVE